MDRLDALGVLINVGSAREFINEIFIIAQERSSSYVCCCNTHMILETKKNKEFALILSNADLVTPDGMPVAKVLSFSHSIQQERVCGMNLMPAIIKECFKKNKSICFYGSTDKVLKNINNRITKDYPKLEAKYYSPPYRELSIEEKNEIVDEINEFNPDFLFVALGCPKQERWMEEHKDKINSCMIGLGGAFPVYAGLQKRAPEWMCNNSLEWLYRLFLEPRRLFGRYFKTNLLFFFYVIKYFFKSK